MNDCKRKAAATRHPQKALKISAKARYALRILKDIADHRDDELATTEAAIAKRQGLSEKFLSRIVLPLRDAGIVSVRRGSRNGFSLRKQPERITLLDIIETVQGPVSILDCLDARVDCGRKRNCFARRVWSIANAEIRRCLAAITLAQAIHMEKRSQAVRRLPDALDPNREHLLPKRGGSKDPSTPT